MTSAILAKKCWLRWTTAPAVAACFCATAGLTFAQTQAPANRSKPFGPDACGPADSAYINTANETGGVPMFLQRSEAGKAFQLVRESKRSNVSTVFWATGTLNEPPQSISIPVDSTIKRITFVFSVDTKGGRLKLTQPSGGEISKNSAGTEVAELNCGRILTVNAPEPGEWRAEIGGAGKFWLQALGQSEIYFIKAEFVQPGGRPGHEGLFRIQGQPLAGTPAILQVSLSAPRTTNAEFYLVNEQGQSIQKLQIHAENADRESLEFTGRVELPEIPFRVAAMGHDANGKPYQRFFSNLYHSESVEISSKFDAGQMVPGTTQFADFTVRNVGAARTFEVTVTDARHFVSKLEPKKLTLRPGESGIIHVVGAAGRHGSRRRGRPRGGRQERHRLAHVKLQRGAFFRHRSRPQREPSVSRSSLRRSRLSSTHPA